MKVKDVMVGVVKTCSANDDLNRAAQIMWENDCGIVPVVEADEYLIGLITDRDACMAAYTQGRPLNEIRVGDVMSRNVKACRPDEDASVLSAAMRSLRVRRVPIVDALGRLVGIVSLSDLARRAAADRGPGNKNLDSVTETLASVCHPANSPVVNSSPPPLPEVAAKVEAVLRPQRAR